MPEIVPSVAAAGQDLPARGENPVRLFGRLHPFSAEQARVELPAGLSLREMALAAGADARLLALGTAWISDPERKDEPLVVVAANWHRVRPKPGMTVTIVIRPGGGEGGSGKTVLRVVLTIAVIALSIYLGPQIALALGYPATGSVAAIASAGVALAGPLAVSGLAPPAAS